MECDELVADIDKLQQKRNRKQFDSCLMTVLGIVLFLQFVNLGLFVSAGIYVVGQFNPIKEKFDVMSTDFQSVMDETKEDLGLIKPFVHSVDNFMGEVDGELKYFRNLFDSWVHQKMNSSDTNYSSSE